MKKCRSACSQKARAQHDLESMARLWECETQLGLNCEAFWSRKTKTKQNAPNHALSWRLDQILDLKVCCENIMKLMKVKENEL